MRARLVSNRYAIGYCSVSLHGTLNQQYCSLAALARERPWLLPGVVLRAASQNLNDCQWQSYHNSLAVERSETDEDRRNVSIVNAVRKTVQFLKAVPSNLSTFRIRGCRRSSSAPCGGTFPPGEGIASLKNNFAEQFLSRGPKDVGCPPAFVTHCQRRLAAKFQFAVLLH